MVAQNKHMEDTDTMLETETLTVLEQHQRLSQSRLWKLQRMFYEQQGIRAWSQEIIPHYATSNPFIAHAYGKVVFGFLRDWYAVAGTSLDMSQPVYIVELGSGSGLFAYHFLKKFVDFFTRSTLKEIPITYVMTDFSEQNVTFWQQHSSLQPFVEQGFLDFATFDVEHPQELLLRHAGTVLSSSTMKNPLVLLANYVFDSISQDCFSLQDGQLYERLVTLSTSEPNSDLNDQDGQLYERLVTLSTSEPNRYLNDPALLNVLKISYDPHPISVDYYDDPDCNQVLQGYQQRFPDTTFLFPHVALRCLRFFRALSNDRLLLLSGDKGYSQEEDLVSRADPKIVVHGGGFSMIVNYHAIGEYVRNQGGQVLHMAHRHTCLSVSAYLLGQPSTNYLETAQAFHEAIEQWGPDEFITLHLGMQKLYHSLNLEQLLDYLRLCGWDSYSFLGCFQFLLEKLEKSSQTVQQDLYYVAQQVWNAYYPLNEKQDLAYALGVLLYNLKDYPEALNYFQLSLERCGPHEHTFYNIAICHAALQRREDALTCIDHMLQLNPSSEPAKALRLKLQSQL